MTESTTYTQKQSYTYLLDTGITRKTITFDYKGDTWELVPSFSDSYTYDIFKNKKYTEWELYCDEYDSFILQRDDTYPRISSTNLRKGLVSYETLLMIVTEVNYQLNKN